MARMDVTQDAAEVHDEIAAELGCVVAVGVVPLPASQPDFEVNPARSKVARTPVGTFESISAVDCPFTVEQNGELAAGFLHPLLDGWEGPKGYDEDAGIEVGQFLLMVAQLRDMLTAGYSTQMA